ncbi:MAG: hypothetical protein LC778_14780 [Acidobacteria bacterium]|nr:hypothetical protein [Acidobacteriota bacterium]
MELWIMVINRRFPRIQAIKKKLPKSNEQVQAKRKNKWMNQTLPYYTILR